MRLFVHVVASLSELMGIKRWIMQQKRARNRMNVNINKSKAQVVLQEQIKNRKMHGKRREERIRTGLRINQMLKHNNGKCEFSKKE